MATREQTAPTPVVAAVTSQPPHREPRLTQPREEQSRRPYHQRRNPPPSFGSRSNPRNNPGDAANPRPPQPLHHVYTVNNIQAHVRTLNDIKFSYPAWVNFFTLNAKGFDVQNRIDASSAPAKNTPDYAPWEKIDAIVLQWIYGTLSDDLLVRILVDQFTAHAAWECVKQLFLNNKGSRAADLQHELAHLILAVMPSVEAYCQKNRDIADQLSALDFAINDNQRVLHLIRGLPREYETLASLLNQTLPPWENACNRLLSEA